MRALRTIDRLLSKIASRPETVSTSDAGSNDASDGSVFSRNSSGSTKSSRSRGKSSCGSTHTYCVDPPERTVWTIPFDASRSSVE